MLTAEMENEMSDSDFALVYKDSRGNKVRKLPIHDAAHVRNALARFNQTDMPESERAKAKARLIAAAKKFDIGEYAQKAAD